MYTERERSRNTKCVCMSFGEGADARVLIF
jgi:hypothetical protein